MKTRPAKFDYDGSSFYTEIEHLATLGLTDKEIADALAISRYTFSIFKNEKGEDDDYTGRAAKIRQALSHGRAKINQAIQDTILSLALGNIKYRKQTTRRIVRIDGDVAEAEITTIADVLPNLQALSTWLFNHDEEWRANIIAHKREVAEASIETNLPNEINIRIVYNQKSDLELQNNNKLKN